MNRRLLLQYGLMSTLAGLTLPLSSCSSSRPSAPRISAPLAGSLFYTEDQPGKWKGKEQGHVPRVVVVKNSKYDKQIQVVTPHEMNGYDHYIVKHIVIDKSFKVISQTLFDPNKDLTPVSRHTLPVGYQGNLYVLSVCNLHDTWLKQVVIS